MVDVAQLVEHPVVVRDVAGSSPVIHPKKIAVSIAILLTIDIHGITDM